MYCRVNFYLNELFSFVLFMTVLLPSRCTNRIITDYKRGAVQCAAAGIRNLIIDQFSMTSMRVWSRKTLSEWLAFKEAYLNVLCLAIVLRALFEKYSINLFSSLQEFPFDALTLIGFSRRLIKSMDTTPLKYLKVRFFKTIRDKIKIKIRIVRIFRWEKTRCTWKGIIFHCHFRRNDPQYRRYPRRRITPLLARLQVCWSFIVFWTVSFRILL